MQSYIDCFGFQLTHSSGSFPEVTEVIPGGSAESDGILRGDRILRVEDEDLYGLSSGMSILCRSFGEISDRCCVFVHP